MIVVGTNLLAMTFAAAGFAAVRRCKWLSEIRSPQEATVFIFFGMERGHSATFLRERD
jgi:hypothetical protein